MAEGPEVCRSLCNAPRRVHSLVMLQAQKQVAVEIEYIDEAEAGTVYFVLLAGHVLGKSHDNVAAHILTSERSITVRHSRISKGRVAIDAVEFRVIDLDLSADEIGGILTRAAVRHANRQSLVNGAASGVIYFYHRVRHVHVGIPPRDSPIFGCEQKDRTLAGGDFKRSVERVKDCSGRRRCAAFPIRKGNRDDQALGHPSSVV